MPRNDVLNRVVVATADVASGGDADLTLPDADGTYRVRVRQTDADGNVSSTLAATGIAEVQVKVSAT